MRSRSKKIVGISINLDSPPSFDKMLELSLKSGFLKHKPLKEAKNLIEKELRANGFTRTRKSRRKKQKSKPNTD